MGAPYTLIKKLLKEQAYGSLLPFVECVPTTDHAPLKTSIWYRRETGGMGGWRYTMKIQKNSNYAVTINLNSSATHRS